MITRDDLKKMSEKELKEFFDKPDPEYMINQCIDQSVDFFQELKIRLQRREIILLKSPLKIIKMNCETIEKYIEKLV